MTVTQAKRFETLDDMEAAQASGIVPGYVLAPDEWGELELWVVLPTGVGTRLPLDDRTPWNKRWSAAEHPDGTVSVAPSIWDRGGWHGWLRRGHYESL